MKHTYVILSLYTHADDYYKQGGESSMSQPWNLKGKNDSDTETIWFSENWEKSEGQGSL